jgi:hypothetical protein
MADDVASISLQVKIDKLREELLKIPGISKQSAEGMLRSYSTEYKKLQKEAQQTADKLKKEAERARDAWKGAAERTASLMGGAFGDISDSLFDLGERFGQVSGSMGGLAGAATLTAGGITAVGFAVGFAWNAAREWMEGIPALIADLREWQGIDPITPAKLAALADYDKTAEKLTATTAMLQVEMAARLAPAMTQSSLAAIGLAESLRNVSEAADESGVSFDAWGRNLANSGILSAALLWAYDEMVEVGTDVAAQTIKMTDAQRGLNDAIRQTDDDARAMMAALGMIDEEPAKVHKVTQAVDELAKARKRAQDELRAQHYEALADDSQRVIMSTVAHQQALDVKMAAEVAFEQELLAVRIAGQEAYDAVTTQAQMARQEAVSQASQMALSANLQAVEQLSSAILQATGEQIAARKREHRATMAEYQSQKDVVAARLEAGKITREQAEERLAQIEAEEALARQQNAETRKQQANAAKRAFAANKAARIAAVVSEAALALVALTTAFAYLGPGAVPAAAAITVPLAATQVGIIAAQKAPKFATGGMVGPDPVHRPIYATPREAVLTERGVDAAGGPDGVASLNRGGGMSSGGGVAAVHLDGALLGAATVQVMRTDPRVRRELARTRGLAVGQRARYAR